MSVPPRAARTKLLVVYGSRSEAITMAPLVLSLKAAPHVQVRVATVGQQRERVDPAHRTFGIDPDRDLAIDESDVTPTGITTRILHHLTEDLENVRPDALLVPGSTAITLPASLAAHYAGVPVVHVEAGLRESDRSSTRPSDVNRRIAAQMAALHLAPTWRSRSNLLREGVDAEAIVVTGTPIIDALRLSVRMHPSIQEDSGTRRPADNRRVVLVSARRSEHPDGGDVDISQRLDTAVAHLADAHRDHHFIMVGGQESRLRSAAHLPLHHGDNVTVTPQLPHEQFCALMGQSHLVVTDSGPVQVEATYLNKPVLVAQDRTDRPEAVAVGASRLIGADATTIVEQTSILLQDDRTYRRMARALNPYGEGNAARLAVQALARYVDHDAEERPLAMGLSSASG